MQQTQSENQDLSQEQRMKNDIKNNYELKQERYKLLTDAKFKLIKTEKELDKVNNNDSYLFMKC